MAMKYARPLRRILWLRRLAGLPLHPMLVHFPLVFWLAVPVFDVLALIWGSVWWGVALGLTAAGSAIGLLAMTTGLLELVNLSETGSSDVRLAAQHGARTAAVWCAMTIKLVVAVFVGAGTALAAACLVIDLLLGCLLIQAAIFGTRITYGDYGR